MGRILMKAATNPYYWVVAILTTVGFVGNALWEGLRNLSWNDFQTYGILIAFIAIGAIALEAFRSVLNAIVPNSLHQFRGDGVFWLAGFRALVVLGMGTMLLLAAWSRDDLGTDILVLGTLIGGAVCTVGIWLFWNALLGRE